MSSSTVGRSRAQPLRESSASELGAISKEAGPSSSASRPALCVAPMGVGARPRSASSYGETNGGASSPAGLRARCSQRTNAAGHAADSVSRAGDRDRSLDLADGTLLRRHRSRFPKSGACTSCLVLSSLHRPRVEANVTESRSRASSVRRNSPLSRLFACVRDADSRTRC